MKPHYFLSLSATALFVMGWWTSARAMATELQWKELPSLPPPPGQATQPGLAGPFVGVHNNALIIAGGANFPDRLPWDGGTKTWWDDVYILESLPGGTLHWAEDKHFRLPRPIAYGVCFNTRDGIVCVGGCDANQCYRDVFLLSWDPEHRDLVVKSFPPLPAPLAMMGGTIVGTTLYVVGGQVSVDEPDDLKHFWSLDLSLRHWPAEFHWIELAPWPGPPRIMPVVASQSVGGVDQLFLFSGRFLKSGAPTKLLTDAFAYDPKAGKWRTLHDVNGSRMDGSDGSCVMAGLAASMGSGEILVIGGDRGDVFQQIEKLNLAAAALRREVPLAPEADRAKLYNTLDFTISERATLSKEHNGFSREVLAYDPANDTWKHVGETPGPGQVTTQAVEWGGSWIIVSGEIRPGVRTNRIMKFFPSQRP